MRLVRSMGAVAVVALLAACSQVPEFTPQAGPVPGQWSAPSGAAPQTVGVEWPQDRWWEAYQNPELSGLIEQALTSANDLKAAVARVQQARAQLGTAEAAELPSVSATGGASNARRSSSGGTTARSGDTARTYRAGVSASYEIDFWGKTAASVLAAENTLTATELDRETVGWTLASGVASSYFRVMGLRDRLASARHNLDLSQQTLGLTEQQVRFGEASGLEAAQQRSAVAAIQAQIAALELQHAQALNALAALLGKTAAEIVVSSPGLSGLTVPGIRPGLPSDLLRRRPDLRAAEARLIAANANIGVARAGYYPSISLTAERGFSSAALTSLLSPASALWSLGASLAAPLFDNGRTDAAVDQATARREELVATYRQSIINALRDTEDALAANRWLLEQEDHQTEVVTAAREARRLADIRYRAGAVAYMTVLDAERTLLQAEDGAVVVRQARLDAVVALNKAIGGRVDLPAVPDLR